MTLSARETVLAAFYALLGDIADVKRFRMPAFELSVDDLPAVVMIDGGDEAADDQVGALQLGQRVAVVGAVSSATADGLGPALSDMRARIRAALGADPTLGGLAKLVRYQSTDDPVVVTESGFDPYAVLSLDYLIEFDEGEFDPYQLGN